MSDEGITKLRVKLGAAEIDYEGKTEFLKDHVMPTIGKMLEMVQDRTELQRALPATIAPVVQATMDQSRSALGVPQSTNTIATLLQAKTGGDLALAAAAKLTLYDTNETPTRGEILHEMQTATTFYKVTMSKNLSGTLKQLAKEDKLRLVAKDTYSLSHKQRQLLEQKLVETG